MKIKHLGVAIDIRPVKRGNDQPRRIREFDEKMMGWYHSLGKHLQLEAKDLIHVFPTFMVRIGGYVLVVQAGGGKYPNSFSLDVFNRNGKIVDSVIYLDGKSGERLPRKWPHGARVVDARKVMRFIPRNPRHPRFIP